MIDLTPIDVRKKKGDFPRGVRGYQTADVDAFLDLVADRMEELVNEAMRLEERLRHVEEQLEHFRERERSLTEALVSAQELRDELRRQAEKEAELRRREAEAEADRILMAASRMREQEEDMLRRIRARRRQVVDSFRRFLERELDELAVVADAIAHEDAAAGASAPPPSPAPAPRLLDATPEEVPVEWLLEREEGDA